MKYSNVLNVFLCMFHVMFIRGYLTERDNACGDQDFCIYQCHCGGHCPKADGLCLPNVQCDKGWFGLRCQYNIFNVELISFGMGYAACSGLTIVVILALALSRTIVCQCNARSRLEPVQHHTDLQQDIGHGYDQREIAEYGDAVSEPKDCN